MFYGKDCQLSKSTVTSFLLVMLTLPFEWGVDIECGVNLDYKC